MAKKQYDIAIIGSGIVGLMAANLLQNKDLSVVIIDAMPQDIANNPKRDGRSTALSAGTIDILQKANIADAIKNSSGHIDDIVILDNDGENDCPLYSEFSTDQTMGYVVENCDLRDILFNNISDIDFIFGQKISHLGDNKITLDNDDIIDYKMLIAADGRNSFIRQTMGVKTKIHNYQQKAITFNIQHSKPHNNLAVERFMPSGPLAVLPLQNNNQSSIVWTVNSDINHDNIPHILQDVIGQHFGNIKLVSTPQSYPLALQYTQKIAYDNVVLIGDAAHIIHPVAGQGINLSARDVDSLVSHISNNIALGLPINHNINNLNKQRGFDIATMSSFTHFIIKLFSNNNNLLRIIRRAGLGIFNKITPVKQSVIRKAMGL